MPSKPIRAAEARSKIRIYLALGVVTLIILLVTLGTAGKQQTLRCDRLESGQVDCVARESILGVFTLTEKTIPGAEAVSMGQECVDVDCNYRLEIYAIRGLVPVTEKYRTNYEQQVKTKDQLNEFFINKDRSFVEMKESTNPILIVGVVAICLVIWTYLAYLIWQTQHPDQEAQAING
jgi:hypothetical protein